MQQQQRVSVLCKLLDDASSALHLIETVADARGDNFKRYTKPSAISLEIHKLYFTCISCARVLAPSFFEISAFKTNRNAAHALIFGKLYRAKM